jgi:hypothetical protein
MTSLIDDANREDDLATIGVSSGIFSTDSEKDSNLDFCDDPDIDLPSKSI